MIHIAEKGFKTSEIQDDDAVIMGSNGFFKRIKTPMYTIVSPINEKTWASMTGDKFQEIKTEGTINLPKVDKKTYKKVLLFLKLIHKEHKSEGCVLLALKRNIDLESQTYRIIVPQQEVTNGHVDYKSGMKEAYEELEEDEYFVGTIHSHPNFAAYQSSTDKNDEDTFDGIHLTFGQIGQKDKIEVHQRFCLAGEIQHLTNKKLKYCPTFQLNERDKTIIPREWLDKVRKPKPTYSRWSGNFTIGELLERIELFSFNTKRTKKLRPMFGNIKTKEEKEEVGVESL